MLAENISLIIKLCSWLGILPVYDTNKKQFYRRLFLPIIFLICTTFAHIWQIFIELPNLLERIDGFLQTIVNWLFYFQSIFIVNVKITTVQKLFNTFNKIDFDLQKNLNVKIPKLKYAYFGIIIVNLEVAIMVLLDFFYNSQVGPWYHHVIFYSSSPWVIYNIHVGEFVKFLFIKATLQRFEAFNSLLEQNIEVSYIGKPTFDIDQYITLHKNLCDLVALFNEIYGLNMLISMFQTIIYVIDFFKWGGLLTFITIMFLLDPHVSNL